MLFYILLLVGCCRQILCDSTEPCTANDMCLPVPAEICDNSKCLPLELDAKNAMSDGGLLKCTWNIASRASRGNCSFHFKIVQHETCDGEAPADTIFTRHSGQYCNETKSTVKNGVAVLGNGLYEKHIIGGAEFHGCYMYFEQGVVFVYRKCKVEPAQNGTACGRYAPGIFYLCQMTSAGMKTYMCNKDQKNLNGPCPKVYSTALSESGFEDLTLTRTFAQNSGLNCNKTEINVVTRKAVIDKCTGNLLYEKTEVDGVKFFHCFIQFESGNSFTLMKCKVEPPQDGKICGAIIINEPATGNCNRAGLNVFARSLGVDFTPEYVDCLLQS